MFKTGNNLLRFSAYGNGNHYASSPNLFDIAYGTLKSTMRHPLGLPRIDINHNAITYVVLSQKCTERRPRFRSKHCSSLSSITTRFWHFELCPLCLLFPFCRSVAFCALNASILIRRLRTLEDAEFLAQVTRVGERERLDLYEVLACDKKSNRPPHLC